MEQGQIIGGRFELVSRLGEGGMAIVWKARELGTGRQVALKLLLPQLSASETLRQLLRREALAAQAGWRSAQVVTVEEVLELPEGPCLVLQLLSGADLRNLLLREGRLTPSRSAALVRQIAWGLAELHGQGVVHCDLKPENLFVSEGPRGEEHLTIIDLGVASFRRSPDGGPATLIGRDEISCTPHYAAPEQLDGWGVVDHHADIYALGVILYELLTGRRPFKQKSLDELCEDVLKGAYAPPRALNPAIPAELEEVVLRAMALDPAERFQGVDELAAALQDFIQESEGSPCRRAEPVGAALDQPPSAQSERGAYFSRLRSSAAEMMPLRSSC